MPGEQPPLPGASATGRADGAGGGQRPLEAHAHRRLYIVFDAHDSSDAVTTVIMNELSATYKNK